MDNMEIIDDMKLIDEIVKRADEHQKQKEKNFAIAELEKVKKTILDYSLFDSGDASPDRAFEVMQDLSVSVIDNEIKGLKGGEPDVN